MRRLAAALFATALFVPAASAADLPAPALDTANWSVSVFGGATWVNDIDPDTIIGPSEFEFDTGFLVGGTLGYTATDWLRTELELAYTESSVDTTIDTGVAVISGSGDFSTFSIMGNVWLGMNMLPVVGGPVNDIGSGLGFSPYFGGGLGVGFLTADPGSEDTTAFAWQVGAGVRWNFASNIGLDVGYRYRNLVDVELGGFESFDLSSNNVVVGLTFNF
jgi:opacity protein-like surface antigen